MSEIKELQSKVEEAVGELRSAHKEIESRGVQLSESNEKIEKINRVLDKLEERNQELTRKISETENQKQDLKDAEERVKELETRVAKLGSSNADPAVERKIKLNEELRNLRMYCEDGGRADIEKRYLRSDSNPNGGFLMKESNDAEIIKPITEMTPLRQYARVKRQSILRNNFTTRDTIVTGYWAGEGTTITASNSTYGKRGVQLHENRFKTLATLQALMGSEWDLESEITGDIAESKAQMEGAAFISGNGVSKPFGMITRLVADSRLYASGSASALTWDAIVEITGQLKTGYSPMYMMNRKTLADLRTLQAPDGSYAWQPGNMAAGVPNQIAGYSYMLAPDMDDIGSNTYPLAFADIRRCYTIVDAMEAYMMRIEQEGGILFILHSFVGGDVVLPEAGIVMKCATSV